MATLQDTQEKTLSTASSILDKPNMTLEEKLAAIDAAMANAAAEHNRANPTAAPIDPMDALHCEGCQ